MKSPVIPPRVSSLLPAAKLEELDSIRKRRHASFSHLTSASSIEDFLEAKKKAIEADLELINTQKEYLAGALTNKVITKDQHTKAIEEIETPADSQLRKTEFSLLVRHKKMLKEDMEDIHPGFAEFDDAYASLMLHKVEAATPKAVKGPKFNQSAFRDAVMSYYSAQKEKEKKDYCLVTGWHPRRFNVKTEKYQTQTKAAHIVPKSLKGPDLNYLFGVGESLLKEARNGLPMHKNLEEAFDANAFVIVPAVVPEKNQPVEWKIVLTKKKFAKLTIFDNKSYGDLDGKSLNFIDLKDATDRETKNRPAARFLYFRFIMTYFTLQKEGNLDWVEEIEYKGNVWATPGKYLRKKMLMSLARRISDRYLPQNFYQDQTFDDIEEYPTLPKDQEAVHEMSLQEKMENYTIGDDEPKQSAGEEEE